MLNRLTSFLYNNSNERKVRHLLPYLWDGASVLDFGCGDGSMMHKLAHAGKKIKGAGTDVVDFDIRYKEIQYRKITDRSIPFGDKTFDIVISYFVYHHTDDPTHWFSECVRVGKRRIIVVESIVRSPTELPWMSLLDWCCNAWKSKSVPMAYAYHTCDWWIALAKRFNFTVSAVKDVESVPWFVPVGRSTLFILDRIPVK